MLSAVSGVVLFVAPIAVVANYAGSNSAPPAGLAGENHTGWAFDSAAVAAASHVAV